MSTVPPHGPGTGEGTPRTERMVASFEAEATADADTDVESGAANYTIRIVSVRDAVPLITREAHPPDAGLVVDDAEAVQVGAVGPASVVLGRIEILQGFDFNVSTGRVTGTLLFDRTLPARAADATTEESITTTVGTAPSVVPSVLVNTHKPGDGSVSVLAGDGVNRHFEAVLTWSDATVDLDAHGLHFVRHELAAHVWHGHRPLGPVFWHYGPSTADALDERLVITSAPVEGSIVFAVHSPLAVHDVPVRVIAESGARVALQLPNALQSMHFAAPAGDGNLWIPFIIRDGQVITTDVVATVAGALETAVVRSLLGDVGGERPAPAPAPDVPPVVTDERRGDDLSWRRPAITLGLLAVALTLVVWMLRGPARGAIMATAGLIVLYLVVQARTRRR